MPGPVSVPFRQNAVTIIAHERRPQGVPIRFRQPYGALIKFEAIILGQVDPSRSKSIQVDPSRRDFFFFLDFLQFRRRFLAVLDGSQAASLWANNRLAGALPRLQLTCRLESWGRHDSLYSAMPIYVSTQAYYITVFDAFALFSG